MDPWMTTIKALCCDDTAILVRIKFTMFHYSSKTSCQLRVIRPLDKDNLFSSELVGQDGKQNGRPGLGASCSFQDSH